jgi:molybdopterin converting factor subunit 1
MPEYSMIKLLIKENMRVKILLFATLRDYVGEKILELEFPEDTTVANLKEALCKKYPKMTPAQNSIIAAINREFATEEEVIPPGAEIALFPPVSGG